VQALHGRAPSHFRLRVEQGTHALRERTRLEPLVDRLMSCPDKLKTWAMVNGDTGECNGDGGRYVSDATARTVNRTEWIRLDAVKIIDDRLNCHQPGEG
jgi:hypothetical protein